MVGTKKDLIIIQGKVVRGGGYGGKIGFPTINLDRRQFLLLRKKPLFGIYAGRVILSGKSYKAGIVIGPLDKKGLPKIEAHLLGFSAKTYGRPATIEILMFLRKFKRFKSEKNLVVQVRKDMSRIAKM